MKDLIVGIHSIAEALKNPQRTGFELFVTDEALSDLRKEFGGNLKVDYQMYSPHKLQEEAKKEYATRDFKFFRVPSGAYLLCDSIQMGAMSELQSFLKAPSTNKLLALDQVTDVHNMAAIVRTASFYGFQGIIFSRKNFKGFPPSYFRIASGGHESIPLYNVPSMSKAVTALNNNDFETIGFSEHAEEKKLQDKPIKSCLVLGAEESGLSHAVLRSVKTCISLTSQGSIKSLNVSVAAAVAMEKIFGIEL